MFYTVLITNNGYMGAQAHASIKDALLRMRDALYRKHFSVVLRDGKTGKRYSLAEACQLP